MQTLNQKIFEGIAPARLGDAQAEDRHRDSRGSALIVDAFQPITPAELRARLWPTIPAIAETPDELPEERALWAWTPPTAAQNTADLAADERAEGFSKRNFRTNPHD